jgi:multiple antibiotic resistance protein
MVDASFISGFALTAIGTVVAISNPLSTALAFLVLTDNMDGRERKRIAKRAIKYSAILMVVFALLGTIVFDIMGISIGAFVMAGGVILFSAGASMLRPARLEMLIPPPSDDMAFSPMTLPFISGAGTLATIVLLSSQAQAKASSDDILTAAICLLIVFIGIALTLALSYAGMIESERLEEHLKGGVIQVVTRLLGLIVMAVGVEFFLIGIGYVLPEFSGLL